MRDSVRNTIAGLASAAGADLKHDGRRDQKASAQFFSLRSFDSKTMRYSSAGTVKVLLFCPAD